MFIASNCSRVPSRNEYPHGRLSGHLTCRDDRAHEVVSEKQDHAGVVSMLERPVSIPHMSITAAFKLANKCQCYGRINSQDVRGSRSQLTSRLHM